VAALPENALLENALLETADKMIADKVIGAADAPGADADMDVISQKTNTLNRLIKAATVQRVQLRQRLQ
jgi:hypothetical protein